ncbi:MAG: hypothetical protein GY906_33905, partial [bacterium]|nr:hypothetical protein [bacterium]
FVFENGFAPNDDEWFYNQTGDNDPTGAQFLALREMRFSLVGRGNSSELEWETNAYNFRPPENGLDISTDAIDYRHAVLTTRVRPRSHPILE